MEACWKILPLLAGTGVDMFGPLESPARELDEVRDKFNIGVMGNVNVDLLGRALPMPFANPRSNHPQGLAGR